MLFVSAAMQILLSLPSTTATLILFEENHPDVVEREIYICIVWFLIIGFFEFVFQLIPRWYLFNFSATFVNQIRSKIYRVLMRQPIEFFEKSENSSGSITHILSSDVKAINNATIDYVVMFFHGISITIFATIL